MDNNKKQKFILFFYNDYESLGLEYISAVLKNAGIKTSLIYKNLVDYYAFDSSHKLYKEFYRKIAADICEQQPDVLGLSLLTDTFQANMAIAGEVKKINPEVKVLVGGVHAELLPELTLRYPQVDALCLGEGEFPTLVYMEKLDRIVKGESPVIEGLVYKQNGYLVGDCSHHIFNNDLDRLPFPDKELFYNEDPSMKSYYFIQCSRGCPFTCSYCVNDFRSGRYKAFFRYRTPEKVIDELLAAKKKYSFSMVVFLDECFGMNAGWTKQFLLLYAEKICMPFVVSLHPYIVNEQLVDLMRDANCWYIIMGVQSLNEEVSRDVLKRNIRKDQIAQAIRIIRSRNITLQCDHILGIPGETGRDLAEALSFYNKNRPSLVSVFWLTYYPKVYVTQFAKGKGILSERDIENIEHGKIAFGIKRIIGYNDINFWLNYFIFFPKWFVSIMLRTGFYRLFNIRNSYISTSFPRFVHAVLDKKDWNRYYLKRIIAKKMNNLRLWAPK